MSKYKSAYSLSSIVVINIPVFFSSFLAIFNRFCIMDSHLL